MYQANVNNLLGHYSSPIQTLTIIKLILLQTESGRIIMILAGYLDSLGFPIIHTLCIIKLCEELVTEVSLTIVTARRR